MTLMPEDDFVAVTYGSSESTSRGGIVLAGSGKRPDYATVVAISSRRLDATKNQFVDWAFGLDDQVLIVQGQAQAAIVDNDGREILFFKSSQIAGYLAPDFDASDAEPHVEVVDEEGEQ